VNARAFHHRLQRAWTACAGDHTSIVCAVSGGVDSVVLLHALHEVNRRKRLHLKLHVGHIDHALRSESADDARWVERLAESIGLPCAVECVDVRGLVRRGAGSVEEAARHARYAALERMAGEWGATAVVVAHHADDQAETVLHHVLRGTGLTGLAGMSKARPIRDASPIGLLRPLLEFTRAEIDAYAIEQGLKYRSDATNLDHALTRNRIRQRLIPSLKKDFNPRVVEALVRLAEQAREGANAIRAVAAEALAAATVDTPANGVQRLDVSRLTPWPDGISREAVRLAIKHVGIPSKPLDHERLVAVHQLLSGDGRRRTIELPGRFAAQRRGRYLLIGPIKTIAPTRARAAPATCGLRRAARSRR